MKAKRPNGGYIFHGGCHGCTNPLSVCPGCMYMEPDWDLPDLNPAHERAHATRSKMKARAYSEAKKVALMAMRGDG